MGGGGRPRGARAQRVVVSQGDVVWASLPSPVGSGPGNRRPAVVVQGDAFNASKLATVVIVPLTGNVRWAAAPGNVVIAGRGTGLPKDSVAHVTLINSVDRSVLTERVGRVSDAELEVILNGIGLLLGRE